MSLNDQNDSNPKIFSEVDVVTDDITYTASCHKLTAIQWSIIRSNNHWNVITITLFGVAVTIIIGLIKQYVVNKKFDWTDIYILLGVFASMVILFFVSFLSDTKRRKIIKEINDKLLNDAELGIPAQNKKRWFFL
ncbi:hypothetical protein D7027_05330 [Ochrobactrum intermedium]|uniref:hypothetical protein n=1 Tax=Brucella intermedia TaxID=94625 RepID=UPI00128B0D70|nr:hypothetical protein [Brucella intermedia]MPR61242.1 hypothetical protein [Brucella intermedia]